MAYENATPVPSKGKDGDREAKEGQNGGRWEGGTQRERSSVGSLHFKD